MVLLLVSPSWIFISTFRESCFSLVLFLIKGSGLKDIGCSPVFINVLYELYIHCIFLDCLVGFDQSAISMPNKLKML